jgi:hypothetical protein
MSRRPYQSYQPHELTEPEVDTLKTHLRIVKLRQLRDSLSQALRDEYGTIAKTTGTEMYKMYKKVPRCFTVLQSVKLRRLALKESREPLFEYHQHLRGI